MIERDDIYHDLTMLIPDLKRRACTPRVMAEADFLLDQLVEIQHDEACELLLDEQEVGYGL